MIDLKDCKSLSSTNSFTVCWSCCVLCFVVPYISNFPPPPFMCLYVLFTYAAYRVSFRSPDGTDGEDGQEIGSASFSIAAGIRDGTPS